MRRLEDIVGPPPSIMQSDQDISAAPGNDQTVTGTTAALGSDANIQEPIPSKPLPSILAVPQFDGQAQWQAFHTMEGYDATNVTGTLCSGRMIGGASGIVKGQRIPLACSDGKSATLQVTELIAGGAIGVMVVDKVQQSASITDSVTVP